MDFVGQLWMPIVISAGLCFVASSIIWMAAPHHKTEFATPPNQDQLASVLKGAEAGSYYFPNADRTDKDAFAAAMKKAEEGPAGVLYIRPRGPFNMGKTMGQQLIYFLVVGFFVAYVGHHSIPVPMYYLRIFQVTGAVAFMAHWLGTIPECIWFGRPWRNQWIQTIDSLIYASLTAGTFGWLWPEGPMA